eukprot:2508256-Karenia_brevis.AAC.1
MHETWAVPHELRNKPQKSRTEKIAKCDPGLAEGPPVNTYLVLRSWMLWRVRHPATWLMSKPARRR